VRSFYRTVLWISVVLSLVLPFSCLGCMLGDPPGPPAPHEAAIRMTTVVLIMVIWVGSLVSAGISGSFLLGENERKPEPPSVKEPFSPPEVRPQSAAYQAFLWISVLAAIVLTLMVFGCVAGDPNQSPTSAQAARMAAYRTSVECAWLGSVCSIVVCSWMLRREHRLGSD